MVILHICQRDLFIGIGSHDTEAESPNVCSQQTRNSGEPMRQFHYELVQRRELMEVPARRQSSREKINSPLLSLFVLFKTLVRRAICFIQSTDSNVNTLTNTARIVFKQMSGYLHGPVKLTQKIITRMSFSIVFCVKNEKQKRVI